MKVTLINFGDIYAHGLRCISSNLKKNNIETEKSSKLVRIPVEA